MIGEFVVSVSIRVAPRHGGVPPFLGPMSIWAKRKAARGRPFVKPITGGHHSREPSPSGEDLQASGDPGHGSGRPRFRVRHRITSFQLLRRGAAHYPKDRRATSDLFLILALAETSFRAKLRKSPAILPKGVTMRRSEHRILTTHTGSLPRPSELTRLYV